MLDRAKCSSIVLSRAPKLSISAIELCEAQINNNHRHSDALLSSTCPFSAQTAIDDCHPLVRFRSVLESERGSRLF